MKNPAKKNINTCSVITIGIFDGVHLGHKAIIEEVAARAKKRCCESIVVTFSPHPVKILKNLFVPKLISLEHRIKIIKSLGIKKVIVIDFNKKFANTNAENFTLFLKNKFNFKELVVSKNFSFGKNKKGNINFLKKLSKKYDFFLKILKTKKIDGVAVSSTAIRKLVTSGNFSKAEKLLGRPFSISGKVIKGEGIGKKFGFPTANIEVKNEAIPPIGVYAVLVKLQNKIYKGALSIGNKPTFTNKIPNVPYVEVYILNFSSNIYGKELEIIFVKKIRDEIKFKNPSLLADKIREDIVSIKKSYKRRLI